MLTRRDLLNSGIAAASGVTFFWRGNTLFARPAGSGEAISVAQIQGGTLDSRLVTELPPELLVMPARPLRFMASPSTVL